MVLCVGKWVAGASSCTTAHLGWWGPVQGQPLTKVLPLPYPLSPIIIIIIIIIIINSAQFVLSMNIVSWSKLC